MADFNAAFELVLLDEGGYKLETVPGDKGGQTYAGITRKSWPNWHGWPTIDAGGRPEAQEVRDFYRANYWTPLRLDEVQDQHVARSILGNAVNCGVGTAAKLVQLTVGTTPDGRIGPVTLQAINAMPPAQMLAAYTVAKVARYRDIVMKDRTQAKFLLGWINRALKEAA